MPVCAKQAATSPDSRKYVEQQDVTLRANYKADAAVPS